MFYYKIINLFIEVIVQGYNKHFSIIEHEIINFNKLAKKKKKIRFNSKKEE